MVHSQNRIEFRIIAQAEEAVRGIRAESHNSVCHSLLHSREYDILLLLAEQSAVTAVRIQTEHCNLRSGYSEIPDHRSIEELQLADYLVLGYGSWHLFQRNVTGHDSHFETRADHNHTNLVHPEFLLQIFSVTGETEALVCHSPLVERCCDKHVNCTCLDISHSGLQCNHSRFCRLRGGLARLHIDIVRKAVHNINSFRTGLGCRIYHIGAQWFIQIMYEFLIESEYF